MKKRILIFVFVIFFLIIGLYYFNKVSSLPIKKPSKPGKNYINEISKCLEQNYSEMDASSAQKDSRGKTLYRISLKSREFIPKENVNQALKCFSNLSNNKNYYAFMQARDALSKQQNESLQKHGILLIDYIPQNAWFVKVSQSFDQEDTQFLQEQFRWVGVIQPQDKVLKDLWQGNFNSYSLTEEGRQLIISFFEPVLKEEARAVIQQSGGSIFDESKFSNKYYVKYKAEGNEIVNIIKKLAEENKIEYIDQMPPPPTINPPKVTN